MNQALERLPRSTERAIIELAEAQGCNVDLLRCEMTRQQGSGGRTDPRTGRYWLASYDLMLCHYCGALMGRPVCPAKARQLQGRLRLEGYVP